VATRAERRAARGRVSAYNQVQLAELLSHVAAAIDRYRDGDIDAYAVNETIHHYHRAAAELWKFCFARGSGTRAEFTASLLDRMTASATVHGKSPAHLGRCRSRLSSPKFAAVGAVTTHSQLNRAFGGSSNRAWAAEATPEL
jgi:hypothetical protein